MKALIFVAGVGVGFVLGSRAGRTAYENLRRQANTFSHSEPVEQVKSQVKDLAGKAASQVGDRVSGAVNKATGKLDEAGSADSSSADSGSSAGSDTATATMSPAAPEGGTTPIDE